MGTDRIPSIPGDQIRNYSLDGYELAPDALSWQAPVISINLVNQPESPSENDRYLIETSQNPGDPWETHEHEIAHYYNGEWHFYTPEEGWITWSNAQNAYYYYNGTVWGTLTGTGDMAKTTYDTDDDGIVDKAETVDDGAGNSSSAVDVKDAVTKKHDRSHAIASSSDHTSSITENNIITGDANGLPKDSAKSHSTDGTLTSNSDNKIPTEKAVKTYVDNASPDLASSVDDFTIKYVDSKLKLADRIETNILLNAFRIAINGALTKYNMMDGITDEFEDESGVDNVNSTYEDYDSTDDYYSPETTADTEVDYMEYATDGAAQSAYVTSIGDSYGSDVFTGGSASESSYFSAVWTGAKAFDDDTGTGWLTDDSAFPQWVKYDLGNGNDKILRRYSLQAHSGYYNQMPYNFKFQGSNNDSDWTDLDTQTSQTFSDTDKHYYTFSNSTSYRYYRLYVTENNEVGNYIRIAEIEGMELTSDLQCYSEDTIIQQGTYSLKTIANQTDSLNGTLTKDLSGGTEIDLTDVNTLKFYCYASRTGTNIQLQIHDSGGTTSTKDVVISSANTWEQTTWDISGISNANKDDIDSIIVKITNADSDNTFYLDDFKIIGETQNMVLVSESTTAESEPDNARLVLFEEDVDSITENTDLKAYISKDGGSTWGQVTLSDEGNYTGTKRILTGTVDLTQSGIGSGTSIKWKITTHNCKDCKLNGIGILWD